MLHNYDRGRSQSPGVSPNSEVPDIPGPVVWKERRVRENVWQAGSAISTFQCFLIAPMMSSLPWCHHSLDVITHRTICNGTDMNGFYFIKNLLLWSLLVEVSSMVRTLLRALEACSIPFLSVGFVYKVVDKDPDWRRTRVSRKNISLWLISAVN